LLFFPVVVLTSKLEFATTMASPAKRTRFDATAITPADKAITPMAAARQSLHAHCASLQPEIATILSKLGLERLQTLHKFSHRDTQAKKIEDDDDFIPRSARVNFALSASKLVEQDVEYTRLSDETTAIVTAFQAALKTKIIEVAKLEVSALKTKIGSEFAVSLRLSVQACILCEPSALNLDADQVVNTLLQEYPALLLAYLDLDLGAFRALYKRTHTLLTLPAALPLVLPDPIPTHLVTTLPNQATLQVIAKVHRTLETTFLTPWSIYLDVQARNAISLQLKKLGDTHFTATATDVAAMAVDSEGAVEPQLIKDLIHTQVTVATRALQSELKALRSQLSIQAKNSQRGPSRASNKNKKGNRAAAANKDSDAAKSNSAPSAKSKRNSKKQLNSKPAASNRRKQRS
jgi:hypothetical protein